jgi:hypothetical protein
MGDPGRRGFAGAAMLPAKKPAKKPAISALNRALPWCACAFTDAFETHEKSVEKWACLLTKLPPFSGGGQVLRHNTGLTVQRPWAAFWRKPGTCDRR